MSPYWNFRKIFDVHPEWDDRCVAIKVKGGGALSEDLLGYRHVGTCWKCWSLLDSIGSRLGKWLSHTPLARVTRSLVLN
jgi:hypothetical protein